MRQLQKPSMALVSRLRQMLPRVASPLPPLVDELSARGAAPLVTPTAEFYRIDIAQTPPQVDPETWSLTISRDGKTLGSSPTTTCSRSRCTRPTSRSAASATRSAATWSAPPAGRGCCSARCCSPSGCRGRPGLGVVGRRVPGLVRRPLRLRRPARDGGCRHERRGAPGPARLPRPAGRAGLYGYTSATKWLRDRCLRPHRPARLLGHPRLGGGAGGPHHEPDRQPAGVAESRSGDHRRCRLGTDRRRRHRRGAGRRRAVAARATVEGRCPACSGGSGRSTGRRRPASTS